MADYIQKGETIDYRNLGTEVIKAGNIVQLGKRVGIAGTDILPNAIGSLHVIGVFSIPKINVADVFAVGDEVFFDGVGAALIGDISLGWAIEESKANFAIVKVKIG